MFRDDLQISVIYRKEKYMIERRSFAPLGMQTTNMSLREKIVHFSVLLLEKDLYFERKTE